VFRIGHCGDQQFLIPSPSRSALRSSSSLTAKPKSQLRSKDHSFSAFACAHPFGDQSFDAVFMVGREGMGQPLC
jgi:hypothetical protein